ncbi:hypothetical protein H9P43_008523 [Blastocladiella emersonii ATCC 22665]|nr:hypothetical protein H9P43_008523 [Blastocladiella emersonii ATCC 22665]
MKHLLYPSYFITGASSGIGRSLALELARRAAKARAPLALALVARREPLLEQVRDDVLAIYPEAAVKVQVLDINAPFAELKAAVEACHAALGNLHCFVINAGIYSSTEVDYEADRRIAMTNFVATTACVEAAVQYIRAHRVHETKEQAHIVGIASMSSTQPMPYIAMYSAAKAGLVQYLDSLRIEVRGQEITVTTILPGFIETQMIDWMSSRPFSCSSERCAALIADRVAARTNGRAAVPWFPWALIAALAWLLPDWLLHWNAQRMMAVKPGLVKAPAE